MKTVLIVFKSGAKETVGYSYQVYQEMVEYLGKDHVVNAKNFTLNMKNVEGVFYQVTEASNEK